MPMKKPNINKNRIISYLVGLFIMTIGVSISVKSNLGVSPVSSIPYTITLNWGIEMGNATILFHAVLVLLQIIILRRDFKPKNLLQIFAGIIFGKFTTFSNMLMGYLPDTDNIIIRLAMLLVSIVIIAFGIFLYVPADIVPLAGEGIMQAISVKTGIEFSKVKIAFDISMVAISAAICLIRLKSLGSVGIGTVIAAVLVGMVLGFIMKHFKGKLDIFLGYAEKEDSSK